MPRSALAALFLAVVAAAAIGGSAPAEPKPPAVLAARDDEVKRLSDAVNKAVADKNDADLAKALGEMEGLRSDAFVPFIRGGLKSTNASVLAASLRAAATHELKDVEKDARKLLHAKPPKRDKDPTGMAGEDGAAAIDYLARLDFGGEETVVVDDYLVMLITPTYGDANRIKAPWAADLLRAGIHYVGKFKAKHATAVLIDLLYVPEKKPMIKGKDPNPPDAWFDERTKLLNLSESWIRWALKEITGQEFRSQREWDAWLKMNKKDYK